MKLFYDGFDVLLYCSFRDLRYFVDIEEMRRRISVISVNGKEPNVYTNKYSMTKIDPTPYDTIVEKICPVITCFYDDNQLRLEVGK